MAKKVDTIEVEASQDDAAVRMFALHAAATRLSGLATTSSEKASEGTIKLAKKFEKYLVDGE